MKYSGRCIPAILAILLGIILLVLQAFALRTISHDDGISYIAATGHLDSYALDGPKHQWALTSDWQVFWTPDKFGCFRQIARDLATRDLHPPMFFWVLHIWTFVAGIALPSAPLLNGIFHLLTTWLIYLTCRRLRVPHWIAGSTAACWLLGGACISVALEVRQYSLLSAASSFFIWSLASYLDSPSRRFLIPLVIATACGMLTHYHFAVLVAGCATIAALQLFLKKEWKTLGCLVIVFVLSACLFYALHPSFYLSFEMQALQAQPFAWMEIPNRLQRAVRVLLEFFIPHGLAHRLVYKVSALTALALSSIGLIALVFAWLKCAATASRSEFYEKLKHRHAIVAAGGLATMVMLLVLYTTCHSPRHAMSTKYLMVVSPLLFIALGQAAAAFHSRRPIAITVLGFALLASQALYGTMVTTHRLARARTSAVNPLADWNGSLILDSVARGVLPTVLWHAAPDVRVFATSQQLIVSKGVTDLSDEDAVLYVTNPLHSNGPDKKQAVLESFAARGYTLHRERGPIFGAGETYDLRRAIRAARIEH